MISQCFWEIVSEFEWTPPKVMCKPTGRNGSGWLIATQERVFSLPSWASDFCRGQAASGAQGCYLNERQNDRATDTHVVQTLYAAYHCSRCRMCTLRSLPVQARTWRRVPWTTPRASGTWRPGTRSRASRATRQRSCAAGAIRHLSIRI